MIFNSLFRLLIKLILIIKSNICGENKFNTSLRFNYKSLELLGKRIN